MKRIDSRLLMGALLIFAGILMLLERFSILNNAVGLIWAGLWVIVSAIFLYWFFIDRSRWWAAIPGFSFAGLAAAALFLDRLGWGGMAFLGGVGAGFWAVYLRRSDHWWAIIPGGVLLTLGVTSTMPSTFNGNEKGSIFFVGLGFTFLLVAILAKMKWAYIPAAVLLVMGFLLGAVFSGALQFAWIGFLLLAGLLLVINSFRSK
jgi:hypothetical protein